MFKIPMNQNTNRPYQNTNRPYQNTNRHNHNTNRHNHNTNRHYQNTNNALSKYQRRKFIIPTIFSGPIHHFKIPTAPNSPIKIPTNPMIMFIIPTKTPVREGFKRPIGVIRAIEIPAGGIKIPALTESVHKGGGGYPQRHKDLKLSG